MKGEVESWPSTAPLCDHLNFNDKAPQESTEQSTSSSPKRPQNDLRSLKSTFNDENDFDDVVSLYGSPLPNSLLVPTCTSPNLSPISTLTLECNAPMMPDLPVDSSMSLRNDITRDDYSGILLPGIQYKCYNEIYTLSHNDGTCSTFHRTLYIPTCLPPGKFAKGLLHHNSDSLELVVPRLLVGDVDGDPSSCWKDSTTSSVDDSESSPNPKRNMIPVVVGESHISEEGGSDEEDDQGCYESQEYTLSDFERSIGTLLFDSECAEHYTTAKGERPNRRGHLEWSVTAGVQGDTP